MTSLILIQKSGSTKKQISINTDHLKVHTKNLQEDLEYQIKFDELGFDTVKKIIKTANLPFYAFMAFVILNLFLLITSIADHSPLSEKVMWIIGTSFFSILAFYTFTQRNKDVIYLTGGQKVLELLASKPDEQTVSDFISNIHQAMRSYYKQKYTRFESDIQYDMKISSLKWLLDINAITEEEYIQLSSAYKTEGIIGFKKIDNA